MNAKEEIFIHNLMQNEHHMTRTSSPFSKPVTAPLDLLLLTRSSEDVAYGARRVDEHEPPREPLPAVAGGAHLVADVADDADLALGLLVLAAQCGEVAVLPVGGAVAVDVRPRRRAVLVGRAGALLDHALEEAPHIYSWDGGAGGLAEEPRYHHEEQ